MPRRPKGDRPLTDAEHQQNYRDKKRKELENMRAELERLRATQQQPEIVMSLKTELSGLREALRASTSALGKAEDERDALKLELARLRQDQDHEAKPKRPGRKKKPVT